MYINKQQFNLISRSCRWPGAPLKIAEIERNVQSSVVGFFLARRGDYSSFSYGSPVGNKFAASKSAGDNERQSL
jgi:hypothetical protein